MVACTCQSYPQVSGDTLNTWRTVCREQGYAALAFEILSLYIDDIPADDLRALCAKTYTGPCFGTPEIVPLRKTGRWRVDRSTVQRPRWPSRDMAMQLLGNLFSTS